MEEMVPLLEQLAAQMNTTVEFLWDVLVRQAQVEVAKFIMYLILFILYTIGSVKFIRYGIHKGKEEDGDVDAEIRWLFSTVLVGILNIIYLVVLFINVGFVVTALLNPEYWALQQILEFIK